MEPFAYGSALVTSILRGFAIAVRFAFKAPHYATPVGLGQSNLQP
jgi:hypothetical protein